MKKSLRNILGVFVVLLASLFISIEANATTIDDALNEILNEKDELVVTHSSLYGKEYTFSMVLSQYENIGYHFYSNGCNDEVTKCNIGLSSDTENEVREVTVKFEEKYSNDFKTILTDGKFVIKSTDKIQEEKINKIGKELFNYTTDNVQFTAETCNEYLTKCTIRMSEPNGNYIEMHTLDIEFKETFSDDFKSILTDGKLVIPQTSMYDKSGLIYNVLYKSSTEKVSFNYSECYENVSNCTISMMKTGTSYRETHVLDIKYEDKISNEFNSLLTDGVLKIKTLKPKTMDEDNYFLYDYFYSMENENMSIGNIGCDENYTKCDIYIYIGDKREMHTVNVEFEKENSAVKTKLDSYIKKIDSLKVDDGTGWKTYTFDLIDLEMINYYAHTKSKTFDFEKLNEMFPYSQTLKELFEGNNYTYRYQGNMGFDAPFNSFVEGGLTILYNDIYYGVISNTATKAKNILYIPSDTKKTPEAFIKAAEKKIKDYIPGLNVKITEGASFEDYVFKTEYEEYTDVEDYIKELIDVNKSTGNVYVIDFGEFKIDFLIVADSTKVVKPEFITSDLDTNISIKSTSSSIPLDTKVEVEKITSGKEYDKLIKILNVEENEMFDIKLYSSAKNEYITKLENGKFEVRIPIPKKLEGKTLIVYYVDENNKITPHDVTPVKGYAVFETDHFSIYTLAEKKAKTTITDNKPENTINKTESIPKVPATLDNVSNSILVSFISLVCLLITTKYIKKNN